MQFDCSKNHFLSKGYFWSSGDLWLAQRKFGQACLRRFAACQLSLQAKIQEEAVDLCAEIARRSAGSTPLDMGPLLDTATANIMCSIIFGSRFEYNDAAFRRILDFSFDLQKGGFSAPENFFPFLYK